jgi:nucleoside-diphosphate-sugar epimerase
MKTIILGRESNLSRTLAGAIDGAVLVSARAVLDGSEALPLDGEPARLVLNSFQPATRLHDVDDPVGYVERAIGATARALDAAVKSGCVERVIYTSSASVYGDNIECREGDPLHASGLHSGLKVANEALVRQVCAGHGIDATVVRLFNMYGGDDRFSIIGKLIRAAREGAEFVLVNEGNAIRDFVHVDDVAATYRALLDASDVPVVNVASGRGVSLRSIIDALALNGFEMNWRSITRKEIRVSTANVEVLSRFVDPSRFTRVVDYVLREVKA